MLFGASVEKVAEKPCSQSCTMSLATGPSSDCGRPKKCSFYRIFVFAPSVKPSANKDGRPLGSWSCTLALPSLNNRHHFLTFPLFIAPSPHTSTIRISARRTFLVFRNRITDHTSQVERFSIHVFILDHSELCVCGVWGEEQYDSVQCSTSAPLDIQQTAPESKCTRYLHNCFALFVTFWTRRVIPCRRTQNPFLVAVKTA